jgi:hypothetical protein
VAIEIDIIGSTGPTLHTTENNQQLIVASQSPVLVTGTTPPAVVVEVLKGVPGDQNVYAGPTPPDNPQEGWIWIDTSE